MRAMESTRERIRSAARRMILDRSKGGLFRQARKPFWAASSANRGLLGSARETVPITSAVAGFNTVRVAPLELSAPDAVDKKLCVRSHDC